MSQGESAPSEFGETRRRIAVIGGGVAGIVSSYLLSRKHAVTLFERNQYIGGHTNTVELSDGPDRGLAIDTGFIVLNDRTYPLFQAFLKQLGVQVRFSDMNFSVRCERTGIEYASKNVSALFAQRRNLWNPRFLMMVSEMPRFWSVAKNDLAQKNLGEETLAEFLRRHKFSRWFVDLFVVPLGASIWSSSAQGLDEFPARTFLKFFENHGWLSLMNQPRWQTVVGGSCEYVKAFLRTFPGTVEKGVEVTGVRRDAHAGVELTIAGRAPERFDHVVISTHADQALGLLQDPSSEERELLGAWSYSENRTVLHTDQAFLPKEPRAWASWNYRRESGERGAEPVSVTYDMNALQGFQASKRYLVTLNPRQPIQASERIAEFRYTHPIYSQGSVATQEKLQAYNGTRSTWFCGSYFGYGFHEDAVRSAVDVGWAFSIEL